MKNKAELWIKKLQLKLHPEGGYYKETYRSNEIIKKDRDFKDFELRIKTRLLQKFPMHKKIIEKL